MHQKLPEPSILFEDEHLLAINKPANMHSVSGRQQQSLSLSDWLKIQRPNLIEVSPKPEDCGLVQRLDFETSGIILAAKSREDWHVLHSFFIKKHIKKEYLALCEGTSPEPTTIKGYIGQRYRRSKRMLWSTNPKTKYVSADCDFKPKMAAAASNQFFALICLEHAVRHQVRLSAATLGYPLVGDVLYGAMQVLPKTFPAFMLHALSLELPHPQAKAKFCFKAPVPSYFVDLGLGLIF